MHNYNILFITSHPVNSTASSSIRNKNLITGFLQKKIGITLICPESDGDYLDIFNDISNIEFKTYKLNPRLKQIKDRNDPSKPSLLTLLIKSALKIYRKFSILKMAGQSLKYTDNIEIDGAHFDLVITSSDPIASHLFFKKIMHRISYNKWCQYWGDPLAYDITNTTLIPKFYRKYFEFNILKEADTIVYVSPFTLKLQSDIYPKLKEKMYFIPPASQAEVLYKNVENDERILISYTGGYNSIVRDIMPLYKALSNSSNKNIKLIISGPTDVILESNENIIINDTVSLSQVREIEKESDLIVIIMNKIGTQIPSKLYYTASTNKDILVLINNENDSLSKYLKQFNRYDLCLNNEDAILNYLKNLTKTKLGHREPMLSLLPENVADNFLTINNILLQF